MMKIQLLTLVVAVLHVFALVDVISAIPGPSVDTESPAPPADVGAYAEATATAIVNAGSRKSPAPKPVKPIEPAVCKPSPCQLAKDKFNKTRVDLAQSSKDAQGTFDELTECTRKLPCVCEQDSKCGEQVKANDEATAKVSDCTAALQDAGKEVVKACGAEIGQLFGGFIQQLASKGDVLSGKAKMASDQYKQKSTYSVKTCLASGNEPEVCEYYASHDEAESYFNSLDIEEMDEFMQDSGADKDKPCKAKFCAEQMKKADAYLQKIRDNPELETDPEFTKKIIDLRERMACTCPKPVPTPDDALADVVEPLKGASRSFAKATADATAIGDNAIADANAMAKVIGDGVASAAANAAAGVGIPAPPPAAGPPLTAGGS